MIFFGVRLTLEYIYVFWNGFYTRKESFSSNYKNHHSSLLLAGFMTEWRGNIVIGPGSDKEYRNDATFLKKPRQHTSAHKTINMVYSTASIRSLRCPSFIIWTDIHSARSSLPEDSRQPLGEVQLVQVAKTHADFPANILHEISQGERKKVKRLHNTLASAPEWRFRRSGCNGRFQRRAASQSWRRVLRSRCHLLRLSGGCSSRCLENRLSSGPCSKCLKWSFQNFSL